MKPNTKTLVIFITLAVLMAVTRHNHFGTAISLPDASLAIFLLAGFLFSLYVWPAVLAFTLLILEAGGIDYYATQIQGVSDWCITPAYGFLIPTYATMWVAGRWLARRQFNSFRGLALFSGVSFLATSAAFLISNISFFLLSGYFAEISALEYASRVQQYYAPYMSGSLIYLSFAVAIYMTLMTLKKKTIHASQR